MDVTAVMLNTPISLIFLTPFGTVSSLSGSLSFSSLTPYIESPLITSKLKAAEPTMVAAPSYPGHPSIFPIVSRSARRISGADEPRAMSDKFATVAFQTCTFFLLTM